MKVTTQIEVEETRAEICITYFADEGEVELSSCNILQGKETKEFWDYLNRYLLDIFVNAFDNQGSDGFAEKQRLLGV